MTLQHPESTSASSGATRLISGVAEVADDYDAFLVDSYGVLHDGQSLYPGSVDCMRKLRERGRVAGILTNTPRRATTVAREIAKVGISADCYDFIVSAGELTHIALATRFATIGLRKGDRYLYIGPERSREIVAGLPFEEVPSVAMADFLIVTGLAPSLDEVLDYEPILAAARKRELPAVCANPDRVAIRAGRRGFCAGAVTARYGELGGVVHHFGKPYVGIYEMAMERLHGILRARVAGVGDALGTDICGAINAGIDSIFVAGGIHSEELANAASPSTAELAALFAVRGLTPAISVPHFTWTLSPQPPRG